MTSQEQQLHQALKHVDKFYKSLLPFYASAALRACDF